MKEFLLAFFQESTHKPLLVGVGIGLVTFITVEIKDGNTKAIYIGLCCIIGASVGYFITPLITDAVSAVVGLKDLGREAIQTLLAGYLAFKNIGAVTMFIKKADKKLDDGKDS